MLNNNKSFHIALICKYIYMSKVINRNRLNWVTNVKANKYKSSIAITNIEVFNYYQFLSNCAIIFAVFLGSVN